MPAERPTWNIAESTFVVLVVVVIPVVLVVADVCSPVIGISTVGPIVKPKWFHGEMTSMASTSIANCWTEPEPLPFTSLELTL